MCVFFIFIFFYSSQKGKEGNEYASVFTKRKTAKLFVKSCFFFFLDSTGTGAFEAALLFGLNKQRPTILIADHTSEMPNIISRVCNLGLMSQAEKVNLPV